MAGTNNIPDSNTASIAFINLVLINLLTIIESIIVVEPGRVKAKVDNRPHMSYNSVKFNHQGSNGNAARNV